MTRPQFTINEVPGCTQGLVYDKTGLFSPQNPYGWDPGTHLSGNPAITDVTAAVLEVTMSDGRMIPFNLYSNGTTTIAFPNTNDGYKTIEGVFALGGIIRCRMHYSGPSIDGAPNTAFDLYADCDFLLTCKFECCIAKLARNLQVQQMGKCTPCINAADKTFTDASDALLAMQEAFKCGDYNAVNAAVDKINALCASAGCGC